MEPVPGAVAAKPKRGCLFYAAVTAGVLLILALGTAVLSIALARNALIGWTQTAPAAFAPATGSTERTAELEKSFKDFQDSVKKTGPAAPLSLTGEDINALIALKSTPAEPLKNWLHVAIDSDVFKGQVSLPLGEFGVPFMKGRHLNADAAFKASLADGVLIITAESIALKGEPISESIMSPLRKENFARDVYRRPDTAEAIKRFESIEIKDGRLTVKLRENRTEEK